MGKLCLNKLSGNIKVGCNISQVGVKNIYLMHTEDVTLTTDQGSVVSTASFAQGAVVTLVEGYKQNIQITSAIRTTDASAKLDFSVMFKLTGRVTYSAPRVRSLLSGRFYVLVEHRDGIYSFIGLTSPMECSGIDWDSNANAGLITVTLATPEGSAGNYLTTVADAAIASIKSKVGV